jgi:hypothetical protein
MANKKHLAILKKGFAAWNEWRMQHLDITPDLRGADLSWADLSAAHLSLANLRGANLHDANLSQADLSGAKLRRADLSAAHLAGANLSGTNLDEAALGLTVLADVDLSAAKGLETVRHEGPSTIGVDTIYRSKGKIPEVFLRGAGLPDEFIAYIGSLVGRPIQFYSCFISYSGKDQEFANRLYEGLQNKGVRCWSAPHDVKAGEKLHEQIDKAIRLHDKMLLILSEHSMNSEWVKTEIFNAREREVAEKKRKLFPVRLVPYETLYDWKCLDTKTGKDLTGEIAEYFIPDFANWKDHDSYQNGFEKLVKDLKAPDAGAKVVAPAKD